MLKNQILIYVAGPYTKGDVAVNVHEAIRVCNYIADLGYTPYCPHLTHFWHLMFPRPYDFWLEYDEVFLRKCNAFVRIDGISSGADKEEQLARALQMPTCQIKNMNLESLNVLDEFLLGLTK